jgi:asparagine synthase (glutamine-hydrolysing)
MCGIAGILSVEPGEHDLCRPLAAMHRALRHRGPDDEGQWRSPSRLATFTHARLSILDLSPAGHQPMTTPDGRFTVVLNGEIYNFKELRHELRQHGVDFQTRTDAEVVLRAYQVHGVSCVARLRGMFAFALWDEVERTCVLARDRFGIKPFYYYTDDRRLVFGSEVRALVASALVPRVVDSQAAYEYFRTGSVPEPRTLLRDVRCLEAGHYGVWRAGRFESRRYWALSFAPELGALDAVAQTRQALIDSVAHHFVSDVPVGIFLSGGIDSTALVALSRAAGQQSLRTFTMSLPGTAEDEGPAARQVAEHFGTEHEDYAVDAGTGRAVFSRFLTAFDQPSIDGLNVFAMAGFARERGIGVVLSGIGADEIFGGYASFRNVPRLAKWNGWLSALGPARTGAGNVLERLAPSPRWRRIGDMLRQPPGVTAAYTTFRGIFTRAEAAALSRHYTGAGTDTHDDPVHAITTEPTAGDAVSRLELARYVKNQLLRDADVMSMAWGLELRSPFLDSEVVEVARRIPASIRLREGKRLLLDAVPEVPPWVASQPKRCFQFPFASWLDGEWRGVFAEVDRTCPIVTHTWYRSWSVFMFERWRARLQSAPDQPLVPADVEAPSFDG